MAVSPLDEKTIKDVIRQVEFYFSNSNLPRDKFLSKTVSESEDGLVCLRLICSFARMKKHLGLSSELKPEEVPEETVSAVAETLRASQSLKISEDGKRVGRSTALSKPEEVLEQVDSRTIAVSPLEYGIKLEDVESSFGQYGKVNSVRLPRHVADKRHFCGTALIEFSQEEDAEKLLKETVVYGGLELEIKPKKDFDIERAEAKEKFEAADSTKNDSTGNGSYPKGLIVAIKLKKVETSDGVVSGDGMNHQQKDAPECLEDSAHEGGKSSSENAEVNHEGDVVKGIEEPMEEDASKVEEGDDEANEECAVGDKSTQMALVNKEGLVMREDLKTVFQKFGTVKFIDYKMGEESGYIRFEDEDAAVKSRAAATLAEQGGLIVKGHIATVEAVTGEAEKDYWSVLRCSREKYKEKSFRGRGRNQRGGRHFDGKRGRQTDASNGRPAKVAKASS